jgi:hypothetical protein
MNSTGIDLMRTLRLASSLLILLLPVHAEPKQHWVSIGPSGKLVYATLQHGDRMMDFSYAGYMGGGVPLPHPPVARTVSPSGADDTMTIQRAIDEVSALPLKDGFRGAVLLAPGVFQCSGTLTIASSGVVLRGSGAAEGGTTLKLTGDPHTAIAISGKQKVQAQGPPGHITDLYLPSGSQSFTLDNASRFAPGDSIRITRYTTPEWLHLMGMDALTRNGQQETWVGNSISTIRTVTARSGNILTLDVSLSDSYDRTYLPPEGAEVVKVAIDDRVEQDGIESLHILAPPRHVAFDDPLFRAIHLSGMRDGWIRDLVVDETTEGIEAAGDTARITIQDVAVHHSTTITSSAKPADFLAAGTQLLILRCSSKGDNLFYVMTGARNQGPNVVLDSVFQGNGSIQPHQRWSTGFLVDNTHVPHGSIELKNRGILGSGHGWTMGWGIVWNSFADSLVIQNPPGAANWAIGTSGVELGEPIRVEGQKRRDSEPDLSGGFIESQGHPVEPASLYRAQLAERLGTRALKALDR